MAGCHGSPLRNTMLAEPEQRFTLKVL